MTSTAERRGSGWFDGISSEKFAAAFASNAELTSELQQHLAKVYATLAAGCVVAAAGSYFYMVTHVWVMLPVIASLFGIALLASTPREQVELRTAYFALVCFSQGTSMGALIELALAVDASLVPMALATTTMLFLGFTYAALSSKRRSMLYLGGLCYSALGWMSLIALGNIFFRSQMLWNVNLYGGLLVFSGYVIFDTQLILEKAHMGDFDHLQHALELFLDLAAIFVRILIILLKDKEDKRNRERRERR